MALYKKFWSTKFLSGTGKNTWRERSVNLEQIESYEFVAEGITRVFMKSSDKFLIREEIEDLDKDIFSIVDAYGVLFDLTRNKN
tara:strand:+ start:2752 stop:3003 length:252 start_codon:yes stop_codon:yes gene_type:complete